MGRLLKVLSSLLVLLFATSGCYLLGGWEGCSFPRAVQGGGNFLPLKVTLDSKSHFQKLCRHLGADCPQAFARGPTGAVFKSHLLHSI